MFEYIKSDLYRYYGKKDLFSFIYAIICNSRFRYQFWLRLCKSKSIIKYVALFFHKVNLNKNLHISHRAKIGYGLFIGHDGPIYINPHVTIGNNCNISQCTTIGSNEQKGACIGDNVYIGPNVCIVEDVKIGNNVTIGAGSVVTKDIPDNATAVGNYAKVINYNNPGRYIGKRWEPKNERK